MTEGHQQTYEWIKALANDTRFAIFQLLMTGLQCNCEIAKSLGISLSLVSHHMHVLMGLGLVTSTRDEQDGRWIYFEINPTVLEQFRQAFLQLTDPNQIQTRQPSCGPNQANACSVKPG
ncbi:MAG: winged helix-turn-helix transcriptional regulator [Anaerolineae bacterium]|nr:winged helix-turn-helix transcriptional regulator [Anaerolineae bacterium]